MINGQIYRYRIPPATKGFLAKQQPRRLTISIFRRCIGDVATMPGNGAPTHPP